MVLDGIAPIGRPLSRATTRIRRPSRNPSVRPRSLHANRAAISGSDRGAVTVRIVAAIILALAAVLSFDSAAVSAPESDVRPPVIETVAGEVKTLGSRDRDVESSLAEIYVITAYTAGAESTGKSRSHPLYGVTASGDYVEDGITLACPPEMPFGTVLRIEGVGEYDGYGDERVCADRGGAIKGKRIDVYIADLEAALELGRREMEIEIISKGSD